jgi:hypothetical protein
VFFLLGAEVGGEQVAGGVGAGVLGEVDEANGRAALFVEFGDFFLVVVGLGASGGEDIVRGGSASCLPDTLSRATP